MQTYSNETPLFNLLVPLTYPRPSRDLDEVLPMMREGNGRYTTGRGAARRSCYEHQLDGLLLLFEALDRHGLLVAVGRHHCPARRRRLVIRADEWDCRCRLQVIHPWELLHAPAPADARALHDARAKLRVAKDWTLRHGPGTGWARQQSARRERRDHKASGFQLPRRSWKAFWKYRDVGEWTVQELLALHVWWETLIPAPRPGLDGPKGRRGPDANDRPSGRTERGAGISPPLPVRAWLDQAMPHPPA